MLFNRLNVATLRLCRQSATARSLFTASSVVALQSPARSHASFAQRSAPTTATIPSSSCLGNTVRARMVHNKGPDGQDLIKTTLFFTIPDKVGALDGVLVNIRKLNISLTRIESRPSKLTGAYDFFIDFNAQSRDQVKKVVVGFKSFVHDVNVITGDQTINKRVPWFPRKIADLDSFADNVLSYGAELDADHPGFHDPVYRERRTEITNIAKNYRHGEKVPTVQYTNQEIETWGLVFNKLNKLYETHACKEYRFILPLLVQNCDLREDNIPQLQDVSDFIKDCTGWTIRPVQGLLSSRDFLNGFAFRVFHSSQYIRHHSEPLYTPEPDVCHELLGHVPLFCDPDFADFAQEIGLASLGCSDEDLEKLARIYWFTSEFGLLREGSELKAYGAGLLSSFGELEYSVKSPEPERRPFDPDVAAVTEYPITKYQPIYYVAEGFKDMKSRVKSYADSFNRPFQVRYNPLTETIEVLDNKDKLLRYASNIRADLARLSSAMEKVLH
ncbi:Biopterin-dependent aromatic amino acid hydroxylase-domain-containing protein [Chytriomyces sp. MP71]|nr:Biopterin-dependent aromatic amino acid hydroxylase-domain-containing protein [Chytriomyces sp. MP71]